MNTSTRLRQLADRMGLDGFAEELREIAGELEAPSEPFGYFRAEPMGWTDCAADDEGAIALYERPAAPAVPEIDYEALIHAAFAKNAKWAQGTAGCIAFARGAEWFRDQMLAATPAAPSQPVTLTDEEIEELQWRVPAARNSTADALQIRTTRQMTLFARAIIAALREKGT